jgi:hypothetical protein
MASRRTGKAESRKQKAESRKRRPETGDLKGVTSPTTKIKWEKIIALGSFGQGRCQDTPDQKREGWQNLLAANLANFSFCAKVF